MYLCFRLNIIFYPNASWIQEILHTSIPQEGGPHVTLSLLFLWHRHKGLRGADQELLHCHSGQELGSPTPVASLTSHPRMVCMPGFSKTSYSCRLTCRWVMMSLKVSFNLPILQKGSSPFFKFWWIWLHEKSGGLIQAEEGLADQVEHQLIIIIILLKLFQKFKQEYSENLQILLRTLPAPRQPLLLSGNVNSLTDALEENLYK